MSPLAPAIALSLTLMLALPLLRARLQYGVRGLVTPRDPVQAFIHGGLKLTVLGYGLWGAALATWGPEALDVYAGLEPLRALGAATVFAGLAVTVLAQHQMGASWRIGLAETRTALITHGLYRLSRNPIYTGILLMASGLALAAPSGWTALGVAVCYSLVGMQARLEEQHLLAEHGEAYRAWAAGVGRFVPKVGRLG